MEVLKRAFAVLVALAVVAHLAKSIVAAAMFLAFAAAFLLPAMVLVSRAPYVRNLPPELRLATSAVLVLLLTIPWYFARKAMGMPLAADAVACIILVALAFFAISNFEPRTSNFLALVPIAFSLAWLGYASRKGLDVQFSALLAAPFGDLVSSLSSLRASSMLPLAYVIDGGPLGGNWYFLAIPATLANFLGLSMPSANALILVNLLVVLLLGHLLVIVARGVLPAAVVLLSAPLATMIVRGDRAFALALVVFAVAMFERRKVTDAILGVLTLAAAVAIGITVWALVPLGVLLIFRLVPGRFVRIVAIAGIAIGIAYFFVQVRGRGKSIPAGYHDALVWVRDHTARNAVLVDPASVAEADVLWPAVIAERRVWLPTRHTESKQDFSQRLREWQATRPPRGDVAVLMGRCEARSNWWKTETRFGGWSVCVHK